MNNMVQQTILERLRQAQQDKSAEEQAKKDIQFQNTIAGVGEGLLDLSNAGAGVQGQSNNAVFDFIRKRAQQQLADAKGQKAENIDNLMNEYKLEQNMADQARQQQADQVSEEMNNLRKQLLQSQIAGQNLKNKTIIDKPVEPVISKAEKELEEARAKEFAKDFSAWQRGGAQNSASAVALAEKIQKDMEKTDSISGPTQGSLDDMFGDFGKWLQRVFFEEQESIGKDLNTLLLPTLKSTFPGQTSDRELQTLLSTLFDPAGTPEDNRRRMKVFVKKLKNTNDQQQKIYNEYARTGVMPRELPNLQQFMTDVQSEYNQEGPLQEEVIIITPAGRKKVPANQVDFYIKKGAKRE